MIAYGDIEAEDTRCLTEINFVKVFRLSQLLVEYLLYVQDCLQRSNSTLADGRWGAAPAAAPEPAHIPAHTPTKDSHACGRTESDVADATGTSLCRPAAPVPHMHAPQLASATQSCSLRSVMTPAASCRCPLSAPMLSTPTHPPTDQRRAAAEKAAQAYRSRCKELDAAARSIKHELKRSRKAAASAEALAAASRELLTQQMAAAEAERERRSKEDAARAVAEVERAAAEAAKASAAAARPASPAVVPMQVRACPYLLC
jgi:hypothetical protein